VEPRIGPVVRILAALTPPGRLQPLLRSRSFHQQPRCDHPNLGLGFSGLFEMLSGEPARSRGQGRTQKAERTPTARRPSAAVAAAIERRGQTEATLRLPAPLATTPRTFGLSSKPCTGLQANTSDLDKLLSRVQFGIVDRWK
jgi:hypothetical protein